MCKTSVTDPLQKCEHCVSKQIIDNVDVAVLSGQHKGVVCISVGAQLAGFEHLLHTRQSTFGTA